MVRKTYTHLNTCRETKATNKENIANTLGEICRHKIIQKNSNILTKHQEKNKIKYKTLNDEDYNNPFKLSELTDSIKISNNTATGPDEIHYQMLKYLPENALVTILQIFNDIWSTDVFPESWRLSTIIPIPKPGKNPAESTNYRPIVLTSCLCKTLERMIYKRLVWYLSPIIS